MSTVADTRVVPPADPCAERLRRQSDAVAPGRFASPVVCITSEQLFAGAAEVQIEHHGALYRLRRTSLGKLILTK
jgi:hemin uptake protein HemP